MFEFYERPFLADDDGVAGRGRVQRHAGTATGRCPGDVDQVLDGDGHSVVPVAKQRRIEDPNIRIQSPVKATDAGDSVGGFHRRTIAWGAHAR